MHNSAFAALELDCVYVPFPVAPEELPAAVCGLRALGVTGFNVTIPHKEAILPLLDDLSAEARLMGAVNTVQRQGIGLSVTILMVRAWSNHYVMIWVVTSMAAGFCFLVQEELPGGSRRSLSGRRSFCYRGQSFDGQRRRACRRIQNGFYWCESCFCPPGRF